MFKLAALTLPVVTTLPELSIVKALATENNSLGDEEPIPILPLALTNKSVDQVGLRTPPEIKTWPVVPTAV